MAIQTNCQTSGAVFHTHVSATHADIIVSFGKTLDLTEAEAELLEANIHNALELVLARYYQA